MRALQAVVALFLMLVILAVAVALAPAVGARDPCPPCDGIAPMNKGLACMADPPTGLVTKATVGPASATFQWQVKWNCPGLVNYQNLCRMCTYVEVDYLAGNTWRLAPGGREAIEQEWATSCGMPYTLSVTTTVSYPVPPAALKPGTPMLFKVFACPWDPAVSPDCDPDLLYVMVAKRPWTFP